MDKIKQLFSKLIENKKLLWSIVAIVAVVTVVAIVLGVVLSKDEPAPADDSIKDCTIKIETVGGMPLENIGIYIYKDSSKEDLISFNRTDKMGVASIDVGVPENSIIVLDGIPEGYSVEESYQITKKETEIKLSAELLEEMTDIKKGGIMFDFTVTDPDGKEYTLSEILKEKKAVVLNLWYTGCQPCKMEFPYLQTAYEKYSEDIEVLAINPEASDNDDAVASFKADNNITFPMAKCSEDWKKVVSGLAYPTTIVIDRFNSIAMIHTGSVDNAKTFKDAFEFFCADDYKQTVVESINDLKTDAPEERDGSLELPYEIKDVAEFDIKAESGTTVYYEIYGKAGKVFSCVDKAIKVIYDETTFEPDENDLITFFINDENADSPVVIGFINDGEETLECKAIFEEPNGTADDPYILDLGNTTVNLIAGNKNGLNYSYSSEVNGVYSIIAKSSDEVSDFEVILTNVDKNIIKNLSDDGIKDSKTGTEKLSVDVSRGDNITVAIVAKADEFGMYPAMSVLITAEAADKTDTTMSENDKNPDESTVDGSAVDPVDSTIATPEDTTKTPEDTTAKPEDTTKAPVDTTKAPENVTSKPEDTTKAPEDTTK
ncbi:MAG: redoxin domain-containing protein, partial [Clostridia bacterium]|nr:redoxin domain-containing protein [Clostridia bacterium]